MTKNFFVRTAAAGIAALVLCGSAVADTWRVATEGTFPPFEFYNSTTGEIQGFESILSAKWLRSMNKDLKLETMGFDAIIRPFSRERSTRAQPAFPSRRNVPSAYSLPFRFTNPPDDRRA